VDADRRDVAAVRSTRFGVLKLVSPRMSTVAEKTPFWKTSTSATLVFATV
jgi:hypothetical protein